MVMRPPALSPDQTGSRTLWRRAGLVFFCLYLVLSGGRFETIFLPEKARPAHLLLGLLLGLGLLSVVRQPAPDTAVEGAVWFLWLAGLGATARSVYPRLSWECFAESLFSLSLFCFASRWTATPERRTALLTALLAGTLVVGLSVAEEAWHRPPETAPARTEAGRPRWAGPLAHPNNLAGFLALTFPVALAARRVLRPRVGKGAWSLALLILLCAGLQTDSRGGLLAFGAGLLAYLILIYHAALGRWARARWPWLVGGLVGVGGLGLWGLGLRSAPVDGGGRWSFHWQHFTIQERLCLWETAERMIRTRPLLGWGPGTFALVSPNLQPASQRRAKLSAHAHNTYLQIAAEQGLLGLVAFLLVFAVAFRDGLAALVRAQEPERQAWLCGLLAGLLAFYLTGLFDFNLGIPSIQWYFWSLLGLLVSLSRPAELRPISRWKAEDSRQKAEGSRPTPDPRPPTPDWFGEGLLTPPPQPTARPPEGGGSGDLTVSGRARSGDLPPTSYRILPVVLWLALALSLLALIRWDLIHATFHEGVVLAEQGRWREARVAFDQARRRDPHHVFYQAHYALSFAREALQPNTAPAARRELLETAAQEFRRALAIDDHDALYHHSLAWVYWRLGQREAALAAMDEAIRRRPNGPVYYADRGWMLLEEGREKEAQAVLEAGWAIFPYNAAAGYFLGTLYEKQGRREDAARVYQTVLNSPSTLLTDRASHLQAGYRRIGVADPSLTDREQFNDPAVVKAKVKERLETLCLHASPWTCSRGGRRSSLRRGAMRYRLQFGRSPGGVTCIASEFAALQRTVVYFTPPVIQRFCHPLSIPFTLVYRCFR